MEEENYCLQNPLDCIVSVGSASLNAEPVYQPSLIEQAVDAFNWGLALLVTISYTFF